MGKPLIYKRNLTPFLQGGFLLGVVKMADNLVDQKIQLWQKKLAALEGQLVDVTKRKGEAASEGDLRENAAYQLAADDMDMVRVQIEKVKKILADLEAGKDAK